MIRHAQDRTGAALKGGFVDHTKDAGQPFVRRGRFLDLERAELAVSFEDDVDLPGVPVAVEIEIRFQPRVPVAFHDLRHGIIFEQRAVHCPAFGHLGRRPSGKIAHEPGVVEVDLRRLDRALEHVVGIGMQKEDDAQRFQNIDPGFCGRNVDIRVFRQRAVIQKLGAAGGDGRDEAVEFQSVYAAGKVPHVALHIGGEIGRIEDIPIRCLTANQPRH